MTKIKQYDWDKLRPTQPKGKVSVAINLKHIKPKKKRVKAIDPTISQHHDNALSRFFKNLV